MTEYQFHWWPPRTAAALPGVRLRADSHLHGAALALRQFAQWGCVITAPLAHVDVTEPGGVKQTVLVEEVLDWLRHPNQAAFRQREGLGDLIG